MKLKSTIVQATCVALVGLLSASALAQEIVILDADVTFDEAGGAIVYENLPGAFPDDLTADGYDAGTLHQKVTVSATPGMRETTLSFCLVQTDRDPMNRACTDSSSVAFMSTDTVTTSQTISTFDGIGNLDLTSALAEVAVVASDTNGYMVDGGNTMWDGSPDFSLYYPLTVRYEAVLVADGETFTGFPSDPQVPMDQVATPSISPAGGSFEDSVRVTIETSTEDAEIRYTTNGSTPTEDSPRYGEPILITRNTEVTARAFKDDLDPSEVASESFTITQVDSGLRGHYFSGQDFGTLQYIRTDTMLDFMWSNDDSPAPGVGSRFSAFWTGTIEPIYSETYTIKTINDDGVRLWVDDQLLIDDWTSHGPLERSGSITLQAGQQYDIWLEYFNGGGNGTLQLLWVSSTQPEETIPGSQTQPDLQDDSPAVSILIDEEDTEIAETIAEPIEVQVRRRGSIDSTLRVELRFGGDATIGEDYEQIPPFVDIPAGELFATIEIAPIMDGVVEGEETIVVEIAESDDYRITEPASQEITLLDFDTESFTIAGTVFYTGTESGKIFVEAFRDEDEVFQKRRAVLLDPGPFAIPNVAEGEYQVIAFIDTNDNERLDADELWVQLVDEQGNPRYVEPPVQDIELDLDDARVGDRPGPMTDNENDDDGGCATTGSDASPVWMLVLASMIFVIRRRRKQLS